MTTVMHWFRRDLRLLDNTALAAASRSADQVIGLYVLDPQLIESPETSPARLAFLYSSLHELRSNLEKGGGRLLIRRGNPVIEVPRAVAETQASAVYFNRDYTTLARRRDAQVEKALENIGCKVASFKDLVLFEPTELLTATDQPYTVFTPYKKKWLASIGQNPPQKQTPHWASLRLEPEISARLNSLEIPQPPAEYTKSFFMPAGEQVGRERLANWAGQHEAQPPIENYVANRNFPATKNSTSQLSPHLRFGTISAAMCYRSALNARERAARVAYKDSCDTWINELAWRDFYYQILWNFPRVAKGSFQKKYSQLKWEENGAYLEAWQRGLTGFPLVDAAMRQLNSLHWMHNRLRMITASFLTKDLLLNWQLGEAYFRRMLVDYDQPANNGGWQWSASTGTDAQPYFRVFNPVAQSTKFDPQGTFIRYWLPELTQVPDKYIHDPSEMPTALQQHLGVIIGRDYPAPIVDHAVARAKVLKLFKST